MLLYASGYAASMKYHPTPRDAPNSKPHKKGHPANYINGAKLPLCFQNHQCARFCNSIAMKLYYGRYLLRFMPGTPVSDRQYVIGILKQAGGEIEGIITEYDFQVIANKAIASQLSALKCVRRMAQC